MRRMPSNPKDSEWFSAPNVKRKRKLTNLSLPDDVRERLEKIAAVRGTSMSEVVCTLVRAAPIKK